MTECMGAPAERWLESYIAGTLEEAEAQAFEDHYFDCPVCLKQVQAMQAVTEQLRREPVKPPVPKVVPWPVRWRPLAAAAALLAAAWIGYRWEFSRTPAQTHAVQQPQPAPPAAAAATPVNSEIADLTLPPYRPSSLRGGADDAHFLTGMKAYAAGDCAKAVAQLARVPAQSDDAMAAQFYSGVCRIQQKDWDQAAATLRKLAHSSDSPEQEAALYYLAQIFAARGDISGARRDLNQVVSLRGDYEQRARRELEKLPGTSPAR